MTKYAAFGTALSMGTGAVQSETATVVGTIGVAGAGNAKVIVTAAGLAGSPLTVTFAVANDDTAALVAGKARTALAANAAVALLFDVTGATDKIILTRKGPYANDGTLNMAVDNDTCTGLTTAATSANTTAGETLTAIAQVQNISGPGLALDTEDVTTHDSPGAFEEHVPTILRTGEVSLELVYDPNGGTHNASTGLAKMLKDKTLVGFSLVFPGSVTWAFPAYVTGFEPSAPHDGALTAAAKLKLTGRPILA
jgi:predicted secreted protein